MLGNATNRMVASRSAMKTARLVQPRVLQAPGATTSSAGSLITVPLHRARGRGRPLTIPTCAYAHVFRKRGAPSGVRGQTSTSRRQSHRVESDSVEALLAEEPAGRIQDLDPVGGEPLPTDL